MLSSVLWDTRLIQVWDLMCFEEEEKVDLERVSKGLKERDSPLIPGTVVHLKTLPKNISQLTKVLSNFYCMYT